MEDEFRIGPSPLIKAGFRRTQTSMELHLVKLWAPLNLPKRLIPLLWNAVIKFTFHQKLPGQDAEYRRLERNLLLLGPEQGIYLKITQVIKTILNDKQRLAVIL
jgi:hypothetical protein